jgi:hypothetical protein
MPSIPSAARKKLGLEDFAQKQSRKRHGGHGHALYGSLGPMRFYFFALVLYVLGAYGALAWTLAGQPLPGQRRILPTGYTPVNQFYAGLALSAILAPAALILRLIGAEIASFHPFALAVKTAISITDLDRIMDPGPWSIRTMLKYSKLFAAVQSAVMLAGFLLVPVGTLILTVDNYAPQSNRQAVVGLPASVGLPYTLSTAMGSTNGPEADRFGPNDPFLRLLTALVKGITIVLPTTIIQAPGHFGPTSSLNLTYESNVRYDGLVTYNWTGGCLPADDDIKLNNDADAGNLTFTFPDNSTKTVPLWESSDLLWSNATRHTNSGVPLDGYTYVVAVGPPQFVHPPVNRENVDYTHGRDGLLRTDEAWITRVKCKPSLDWDVSSCVWNGTIMNECISTPGKNTTALDTVGLDLLPGYMTAVSWLLFLNGDVSITHPYQVYGYTTEDINIAYGVVALAIAQFTTMGFYGTATVVATGQSPAPVYIVRVPVLLTIALLLTLVVTMVAVDIQLTSWNSLPVRKTSFLTIATAVRGSWWDSELYGRCTLGRSLLRSKTTAKVMFGVDPKNPYNVGFAPVVLPIERDAIYYGVDTSVDTSVYSVKSSHHIQKIPSMFDA